MVSINLAAWQLSQADEQWIQRQMGVVGLRVVAELKGRSCLDLEACPAPKQGIICSRAFGRPVRTLAEMEEAVSSYVSRVAEKLRGEELAATVLTVFIMTNAFTQEPQYRNSVTCALPVATDTTSELIRAALTGLRRIYRDGYRYKKAGVMCTALVPAGQVQPDLFDRQDRPKSKRLMAALDAINDRWGAGTLDYASNGLTQAWQTHSHRRSPAYTTNWAELPVVRAS